MEGDPIELPTKIAGYYGLRRSEILGLRIDAFDFEENYFTKRFHKLVKRYQLKPITPHGLRHSIATLLHLEGVDIRNLQDWLGHQSISSTNRYTRSDYQKQLETGRFSIPPFRIP